MRQKALEGLRKYQEAERRPPIAHGEIHAKCGDAKLLRFRAQSAAAKTPVVLIASLVNSHEILDLAERTSLTRYLLGRGHDPWLVDWGKPDTNEGGLNLAQHIEERLLPLLQSFSRPPILVGYCLGGPIALAAAQLTQVSAVAAIAAPWHFDRMPEEDRALITDLWRDAKPLCERLGYVPMEVLQTGFWALDPHRTIRKYAAFADVRNGSDEQYAFLALEDWANEGEPLTYRAAQELFEQFYAENITGSGRWLVGGKPVRPEKLECPGLSILSTTDKIVRAETSAHLTDHLESSLGHVGMIVSAKAPQQIWLPLSEWLSQHGA